MLNFKSSSSKNQSPTHSCIQILCKNEHLSLSHSPSHTPPHTHRGYCIAAVVCCDSRISGSCTWAQVSQEQRQSWFALLFPCECVSQTTTGAKHTWKHCTMRLYYVPLKLFLFLKLQMKLYVLFTCFQYWFSRYSIWQNNGDNNGHIHKLTQITPESTSICWFIVQ